MVGASGVNAQTVVFHETFGNADARVSSPYVPQALSGQDPGYYSPRLTGNIDDGTYAIMRPQDVRSGGVWWVNLLTDHSGDPTGALMVLNAGRTLSDFYRRNFDVKAGASYEISVWRYVVNANGSAPIAWSLQVKQVNSGTVLVNSGSISNTTTRAWEQSTFRFTIPASCAAAATGSQATMALTNQSPIAAGNDIYIDDIKVTELPLDPSLPSACPSERSAVDAVDNAATTPPDTAVTINVLGNDTTSAGTLGAPVIDTPPEASMGTAVVNPDGTITFTPAAGFRGLATFTYRVCNGAIPTPACDTAKVDVLVTDISAVPTLDVWALLGLGSLLGWLGMRRSRR